MQNAGGGVAADGAPVGPVRRGEDVVVFVAREDGAGHGARGAVQERRAVLHQGVSSHGVVRHLDGQAAPCRRTTALLHTQRLQHACCVADFSAAADEEEKRRREEE